VPLLAVTGLLDIGPLLVIAFGVGAMTALFDVAHLALLPSVVPAEQVASANSRLQTSYSSAQVLGPGLGGVAVATVGAPAALILDAGSYLCAAVLAARIRVTEAVHRPAGAGRRDRLADALSFTFGNRLIRTLLLHAGWFNLFEIIVLTLYPLYVIRTLGLGPAALGITLSVGGIGAVIGAALSQALTRTAGLRCAVSVGMGVASGALLLIPLADAVPLTLPLLCLALFGHGLGLSVYNVQSISIRQLATPGALIGRLMACYRMLSYGPIPLGSAAGGLLASRIGVSATLWVAGIALVLGAVALAQGVR
jgi:predicted MFS family arabinose efflux permease